MIKMFLCLKINISYFQSFLLFLQKMKHCNFCKAETLKNACSCGKVSYCGVDCQKSDWKSHKPDCPPFKVIKIPRKGQGLVATRKLNVGEVIIAKTTTMLLRFGGCRQCFQFSGLQWTSIKHNSSFRHSNKY